MPATDYLRLARGGGIYSVRMSWVCGSSNCLFVSIFSRMLYVTSFKLSGWGKEIKIKIKI